MKTLLGVLLLLLVQTAQAAMEVIGLNWRSAAELLPAVQSVLGQEGSASAYGQKLIVNAQADKIRELRALLAKLDTRPRRLLISLDRGQSRQGELSAFRAGGSISAGNAEIRIGDGETNGRDRVRIIQRSTADSSGGVQQIQTNEGYAALIQGGQSVPLTHTWRDGYGKIQQETQYRDLNQGFYLTATVSGEQVVLDISSQNDRQSGSGHIQLEQVATKVSGRLGQWIALGGMGSQDSSSASDILQKRSGQGSSDMQLRVKVELLD